MIKLEVDFFEDLYLKAKLSFDKCISNPDNNYLKDEIDVQIDEIILMEDFIRVQFFQRKLDKFVIEVKLQLISKDNRLIGSYFYYEDEKNTPLDDSLIFN
ncbi:hypothetical protein D3C87_92700 [compost metagenome]|uniref:hypothetical protein n=1 Tax=Pedobacter sp. ok626 TaxID=1761882 RepID=UPI0008902D02|nr:hypothetical protein [Pedobacter sp. ok626]SDK29255.1 hypothetical protein SAMN04487898_107121 [Pedobacter sp. ok626]